MSPVNTKGDIALPMIISDVNSIVSFKHTTVLEDAW